MRKTPLLYFAGPLFSHAELSFNEHLLRKIEALGYRVYFPQRDGFMVNGRHPVESKEGRAQIFNRDRDHILACDVFLFILDGRVPDEGACVELGIAYTHKQLSSPDKKIIGLHTDIRYAFAHSPLNPMLEAAFDHIVVTIDNLVLLLTDERSPQG